MKLFHFHGRSKLHKVSTVGEEPAASSARRKDADRKYHWRRRAISELWKENAVKVRTSLTWAAFALVVAGSALAPSGQAETVTPQVADRTPSMRFRG